MYVIWVLLLETCTHGGRFCLRGTIQLGLALALGDPEDGIITVVVDRFVVKALLPAKGQGMNDSKELIYVIGAMDRSEMEHTVTCLQVDGLIFHRPQDTPSHHRPANGCKGKRPYCAQKEDVSILTHPLLTPNVIYCYGVIMIFESSTWSATFTTPSPSTSPFRPLTMVNCFVAASDLSYPVLVAKTETI